VHSQTPHPSGLPLRRAIAWVFPLVVALSAAGCSRLPVVGRAFERGGDIQSPVEVTLQLQRLNLRPGDPAVAFISIRNITRKKITVQMPDASSLEFYVAGGNLGTEPVEVRPVFSPKEPLGRPQELESHQVVSRTFVFTTLTKEPGEYRFQTIYHPTPKGMASGMVPAVSKPVMFRVAGQRAFHRDRDGVLLKEDAIAIAKRAVGLPTKGATAFLLEDKAGFLNWWVTVEIDPAYLKPGQEKYRAFFINPYLATIIKSRRARPYVPKAVPKAKDTRTTVPLPPANFQIPPPPPPAGR